MWAPILLIGPLIDASVGGQLARVLSVIVLAGGYTLAIWLPFAAGPRASKRSELAFVLLLALGAGYLVAWHVDAEFVYPLLAIGAAIAVRQRWALGMIAAVTISGAVQTGIDRGSLDIGMLLGFATFMAGIGNFLVQYLVGLVNELTRTQERLAQTAVAEERLRFSRDLHDLLGHTLSVIVVKAQAIRRLIERDPDVATVHAADIETIGRHALTEVREAVTGYRSVGLADELANARRALEAVGILVHIAQPAHTLEAHLDSLLGWVVREAITNVLKHADATRCSITITTADSVVRIEIVDDGQGRADRADARVDGSGLRGLRERVEEYGGVLTATTTSTGFRLAASIPERVQTGVAR
jgi:two-component system sensor histidine kinase DesK